MRAITRTTGGAEEGTKSKEGGKKRVRSRCFSISKRELTEKSLGDSPNHHSELDVGSRESSGEIDLEDGEKGDDEVGGGLKRGQDQFSSRAREGRVERTCMFPAEKVIHATHAK